MALHAAIGCVAILALALASSAGADHWPPPFDQATREGGYVAWRVAVPSPGQLGVQLDSDMQDGRVLASAIWMLDGNGQVHLRHAEWGYWGDSRARVEMPGTPPVRVQTPGWDGGSFVSRLASVDPGEWLVVALVVADGPLQATYRLHAEQATALAARTQAAGFLFRDIDFGNGTSVTARTLASARIIRDASVQADVQGRLFAGFHANIDEDDAVSVETPDGFLAGRTSYDFAGSSPGPYLFRIDEVSQTSEPCAAKPLVPLCNLWEILVFGADVTMP